MYTHSHLRYGEAMSDLGESEALWSALMPANPIAVTDRLAHASLRQRNAYFSSSDAAFQDRYQASAEWVRVKTDKIAVDGGWRIYSSGSGLTANRSFATCSGRAGISASGSSSPACRPRRKASA
jgi:cellobiose phosphorylase